MKTTKTHLILILIIMIIILNSHKNKFLSIIKRITILIIIQNLIQIIKLSKTPIFINSLIKMELNKLIIIIILISRNQN